MLVHNLVSILSYYSLRLHTIRYYRHCIVIFNKMLFLCYNNNYSNRQVELFKYSWKADLTDLYLLSICLFQLLLFCYVFLLLHLVHKYLLSCSLLLLFLFWYCFNTNWDFCFYSVIHLLFLDLLNQFSL